MTKEAQDLIDKIEGLWKDSLKDTKFSMYLGRYIITYNPYDDKETTDAYRLAGVYYEWYTKEGRELAEEMLIKAMEKHE